MSRILIVDDEASICWAFRELLADEGHHVEVAASAEEGLRIAGGDPLDAVVLDVRLPGMDGLTAMPAFREPHRRRHRSSSSPPSATWRPPCARWREARSTTWSSPSTSTRRRPSSSEPWRRTSARRGRREPSNWPRPSPRRLIGTSARHARTFKSIALVAPTDVPVLITGESGTGKELVARAIHRHSGRRDGPFCRSAWPRSARAWSSGELFGHLRGSFTGAVQDRKGLLELASGGTVLLDEVGDIPPDLQVKLLRAIEHREVTPVGDARPRPTDIRLIAATNRPLDQLMATGQFREDLFFRLSVFPIHIPPLRDRRGGHPGPGRALPAAVSPGRHRRGRVSATTLLDELRSRPWVGNIRELRNAIEHAAIVARGQPIRPEHLPAATVRVEENPASDRGRSRAGSPNGPARGPCPAHPPGDASLYERFLELVEPPVLEAVLEQCRTTAPPPPSCSASTGPPSDRSCGNMAWPSRRHPTKRFLTCSLDQTGEIP